MTGEEVAKEVNCLRAIFIRQMEDLQSKCPHEYVTEVDGENRTVCTYCKYCGRPIYLLEKEYK